MTDRQPAVRNEQAAILEVFDNQFPTLTSHVLENLYRVSRYGEKWPATLLVVAGAFLLLTALAIKLMLIMYYYRVEATAAPRLSAVEFTTLILAAAGLMVAGALFSLLQSWSWRRIVLAQQAVGIELLNKQIDIARDIVVKRNALQGGELILLPAKIRKRHRR